MNSGGDARFQMALVTRVLETGELRPLRLWGISHDDLTDDEAALALEYVSIHFDEYGIVPTKETVKKKLPSIGFVDSGDEDLEILCSLVADEIAEARFRKSLVNATTHLDNHGPIEAARILQREFLKLSGQYGKTDTYILGSRADIEYKALTTEDELEVVVPCVWRTLQLLVGGIRENELWILYGKRGNGKTWTLIEQGEFAARRGHKVLFVTTEMSRSQIMRRIYALRAGFPYADMRTKKLFTDVSDAAENRLRLQRVISSFLESSNFIIFDPEDEEAEISVEVIEGLIDRFEPDILLIDQLHYLDIATKNEGLRHKLGAIAKRLKKLSRVKKVPIMATTQSNKDGEVAESYQLEQISDLLIWLEIDKEASIRKFDVKKAREIDDTDADWHCFADFCASIGEVPENHSSLIREASKGKDPIIRRSGKQQKLRGR